MDTLAAYTEQCAQWLTAQQLVFEALPCPFFEGKTALFRLQEPLQQRMLYLHLLPLGLLEELPMSVEIWSSRVETLENHLPSGSPRVHLWQDRWLHQPTLIQKRLLALLHRSVRIAARWGQVRRIDQAVYTGFLDQHHLQKAATARLKYGLFVRPSHYLKPSVAALEGEDKPIAVAGFSNPRTFWRNGLPMRSCELVRFASRQGYTVVGGLDKLLSHFTQEIAHDDLMTYTDTDWSVGESFRKLGFEQVGVLPPVLMWAHPVHAERIKLPATSVAEEQCLAAEGWKQVYNSGSRKWLKTIRHADTL